MIRFNKIYLIFIVDLELSATDCPLENIDTLGRYQNKTLVGGFESGNYTYLGRIK